MNTNHVLPTCCILIPVKNINNYYSQLLISVKFYHFNSWSFSFSIYSKLVFPMWLHIFRLRKTVVFDPSKSETYKVLQESQYENGVHEVNKPATPRVFSPPKVRFYTIYNNKYILHTTHQKHTHIHYIFFLFSKLKYG